MTTEQNLGPERLSLLACSPVPGAGTSLGGERRAREISDRKEETVKTESGSQQSEVQVVSEVKKKVDTAKAKRRKILPRELRIKVYNRVIELRQQGLSYSKINDVIEQEYGVSPPISTISYWTRGLRNPYKGRYIPSLDLLKPSEELAYVIGVKLGDGCVWKKGYEEYAIGLKAKDKEFVDKFATCLAKVLGRKPIKVRYDKSSGRYVAEVISKTLYELLRKPIDINRIRKYVEHCPRCIVAFLRGLFDSEGHVDKDGFIYIYNTNYELLTYVQKLLKRLGIGTTGPKLNIHRGTIIRRNGKQYMTKEDVYRLYIRATSADNFYRLVGFTIERKRRRLEEYLRRTRKI